MLVLHANRMASANAGSEGSNFKAPSNLTAWKTATRPGIFSVPEPDVPQHLNEFFSNFVSPSHHLCDRLPRQLRFAFEKLGQKFPVVHNSNIVDDDVM